MGDWALFSELLKQMNNNGSGGDELLGLLLDHSNSSVGWWEVSSVPSQQAFFLVWLIATTIGFVSNTVFICIISYGALLNTYTSCYLYNLSVANLVFLTFQLIDIILVRFYQDHYYHYYSAYVAIRHICVVVPNLSFLLTLLVVSAEHYVYISRPRQCRSLTTPGNNRRTLAQIGFTWVAAMVADLPFLLLFAFDSIRAYKLLHIMGCTILVFLTTTTLAIVSWVHCYLMCRLSHCQSRLGNPARSRIKRIYHMFAVTTVLFYICFVPFVTSIVFNMTLVFSTVGLWLDYLSFTLLFVNCVANPAIYQLYSSQYRQAFKSLCHLTCSRRRQQTGEVVSVGNRVVVLSSEIQNNYLHRHNRHFPLAIRVDRFNIL